MIALTAFGGPQAHIALFLEVFVNKRRYITESDLLEIHALCQVLPGPSTTQTLTAIAYKRGGTFLAFLALLVWTLPAVSLMTGFALVLTYFQTKGLSMDFTTYIQPIALGLVSYSAYIFTKKSVDTKTAVLIFFVAGLLCYVWRTPYAFPLVLVMGGFSSAYKFKKQEKMPKERFNLAWQYFFIYVGIFVLAASLGALTHSLPIRLFENFYRNGSLIFGGGQVLIPALYYEFVSFKKYLLKEEFLLGYALEQSMPGPVFSFSSFVGALSMREHGFWGEILGGLVAAVGVFLPGTLLIFFVIRFWDQLKKFRVVRASLEGINAAGAGLVVAGALVMLRSLSLDWLNMTIFAITIVLKITEKAPTPLIIAVGVIAGILSPLLKVWISSF